ncbi:MAG TPA: protein translocase subunit SecD [Tepidisphaeraceae bacterium]|nr:protein translocase subunit SecD [Tepidisphaeraceae bacterium]
MPTKFTGRITFILFILGLAVILIFPPSTMFDSTLSWRERCALKPGIDIVGGVKLVYKIKPPQVSGPINNGATDLAEQVMEALKKRVDPDGVRNLVWRPIGSDELEIQMPLSSHSEDAPRKRQAYTEALTEIEATNVHRADVLDAISMPPGPARVKQIEDLTQGDPKRLALFDSLAQMHDQLAAAAAIARPASGKVTASPDDLRKAIEVLDKTGEKFDEAEQQIEDDNINTTDLESILDGMTTDPAKFGPMLSDLRTRYADFPARAKALDNFVAKYNDYLTVKSSLDDAADLKRLLKGSGVLEFHIVAYNPADPKYQMMYARMRPGGQGPSPQPGDDTYQWFQVDRVSDFDRPGAPPRTVEWNDKHYILCLITPDASMTKSQPWALERAFPSSDDMGMPVVGFQFDTNGGHLFGDLTTRWKPDNGMSYQLATTLDGKIITAPNINGPITGGSGIITGGGEGGFSQDDLTYLVNTLNAGSLPAQLEDEPISEQRVGSTLGADNLRKGLVACGFGLVVVGVFMIGYYYVAGLVAFVAIIMNLLLILGCLAAMGATFTLPSIAAIVLSVGTAVDANVLIFERLREEQHRGLGLKMALRNSYDRAFSAIIDSNMTSVITSIFLYMNGTEEVKGFGLTLVIGIGASLFTALFVTKTIFGIMIEKFGVKNLSSLPLTFPKWDKMLKPNIDWMGMAWAFYTFSIIGITGGLILFGIYAYKGEMLGIEFSSGTSVQFELKQPQTIGQIRDIIDKTDLPSPSVVSLGTDQAAYEVITPSVDTAHVKQAVVEAVGPLLNIQLPSRFTGVDDATVADALRDKVLFPIPADLRQWPYGTPPPQARDYTGGVAIRLNDINPALTPQEIRQRIYADEPQTPGTNAFSDIAVVAGVPNDMKTTSALVLISHQSILYSPEREGEWRTELAAPAWNLVRGAVNHEASLRGVNSFNPSVAGDARRAATVALTLSIIAIMVYIWIRFGNLKYGTATMVALLHDTIFTVAALGYSHLLADTAVAGILELEPFRIDLTIVAGILTIMSYSMIDTIVVFDRIRENRGKFGHLSRSVINDAINQTLSRTLLTCGTTTITVAFMYFLGGPGIHGFTYVLLIGILVGTYSSVAIAAPLLLIHSERERRNTLGPPSQMVAAAG